VQRQRLARLVICLSAASPINDRPTEGSAKTYLALAHVSIGLALTRTSLVPKAAASCAYVNDMIATT
jgi:hypothetical protein